MREIKFRGKRKRDGKWICGFYFSEVGGFYLSRGNCPGIDGTPEVSHYIKDFDMEDHEVDPATVGQFTGLRDKNGREIYEGDIVEAFKHGDEEQRFELAATYQHCFMFGNWTIIEFLNKFRMAKVIGDIHDNPDLLK